MKRWVLAAGLLAAAFVPPTIAADLDDGAPPPPWRGGAYDDRRFEPPHGAPPPPPGYTDDDDDEPGPAPRRYSDVPPPPPPRFAAPGPGRGCVRSEQVKDRLTSQGWRDFHDGKPVSDSTVTLRARRPSGRLFELQLDRCSGEVVAARPLELRPFGPYAYREPYGPYGAWRWGPERAPYDYSGPYAYSGPTERRPYDTQRRWYGD